MGWIKEEGKINDDTYLIDSMLFGREGSMACYLVVGTKKKVLIDASSSSEARGIVKKLTALNLIPDILILTHSHWDHSGGTNKIKKKLPEIEIMASHKGLESLKNQQEFNKGFSAFAPKLNPIDNFTPLKENDVIDIGSIELKIFETPGHTNCCISILDQKNKNLFLGDSLGYKPSEDLMMAPIMPPEFSEKKLLATIDKVKKIDYLTVS
ncbi:MAG: MBL fold metallo-hydrolase, partial [Candidatus Hodarchaeota archaeon]